MDSTSSPFLKGIFGAGMIGVIVSAIVFGILTLQVWVYFNRFPKDRLWMKIMVITVWAVEAFQISTTTHMVYTYLVDDFGQFEKLARASWDWCLYLGQASMAALLVELFFVYRLFSVFNRHKIMKWVICIIITTLGVLSWAFGLYVMIKTLQLRKYADFTAFTWAVDSWLACASVADLVIAGSMCYFLHTSRTGIERTNRLINRLMAYSVQTGAITSFTEIMCLVTFTITGFHYGHVFLIFPLGGFYATSLLANLNARRSALSDGAKGSAHVFELGDSTGSGSTKAQSVGSNLKRDGRHGIKVGVVSFSVTDTLPTSKFVDVSGEHDTASNEFKGEEGV